MTSCCLPQMQPPQTYARHTEDKTKKKEAGKRKKIGLGKFFRRGRYPAQNIRKSFIRKR